MSPFKPSNSLGLGERQHARLDKKYSWNDPRRW